MGLSWRKQVMMSKSDPDTDLSDPAPPSPGPRKRRRRQSRPSVTSPAPARPGGRYTRRRRRARCGSDRNHCRRAPTAPAWKVAGRRWPLRHRRSARCVPAPTAGRPVAQRDEAPPTPPPTASAPARAFPLDLPGLGVARGDCSRSSRDLHSGGRRHLPATVGCRSSSPVPVAGQTADSS